MSSSSLMDHDVVVVVGNLPSNDVEKVRKFQSPLTFAHSRTVVNDKGSDIFVISHFDSLFVIEVETVGCFIENVFVDYEIEKRSYFGA